MQMDSAVGRAPGPGKEVQPSAVPAATHAYIGASSPRDEGHPVARETGGMTRGDSAVDTCTSPSGALHSETHYGSDGLDYEQARPSNT